MSNLRLEHRDGKTRVWDVASGLELENVMKVEFTHAAEGGPRLIVTLVDYEPAIGVLRPGEQIEPTDLKSRVRSWAGPRGMNESPGNPVSQERG